MSKFWSVILKIIIVISILGIIFFVGVAILRNQNISFEAYNYISSVNSRMDFEEMQANISSKVREEFDGDDDLYADFINSATTELNNGISYFLDYLAHEDGLTKGEQDKLINLYYNYVNNYHEFEVYYDKYIEAYDLAEQNRNKYEESDYLRATVRAASVYLVESYVDSYRKGSEFFKYLVEIVNKYTLSNSGLFSFKGQGYMIKCGLVDYSLDFVSKNLKHRLNVETDSYKKNPRTNQLINNYYLFINKSATLTDANSVTNTEFRVFINNLNTLNIFEWAGNYANYFNTLDDVLATNAYSALTFYNNNFKG